MGHIVVLYEFLTATGDFRHNVPVLPMDVDGPGLVDTLGKLRG